MAQGLAPQREALARRKSALRRVWWAVVARFLVHGLVTATWISRIPAIKESLGLNNGVFGLALLGSAVGSLAAIPVTGWLVSRYGSGNVATVSSFGYCLALFFPPLAGNAMGLFAALLLLGAMAGSNDVSMNAQAVTVEHEMGSPTMSRFHAMFSIGGMAGAAVGGAIAARHAPPLFHLIGAGCLFALITASTTPLVVHFDEKPGGLEHAHRLRWNAIPPVLFALCVIAFSMFLSEGAMADWIAVYLRETLRSGPGTAAAGYAVFSVGMAIVRLLGDAITVRLGATRTVRFGCLLAAFGIAFALLMPSPVWALPGFAAAGAGFSVIVPLVFGAGGRVPGVSRGAGIAMVSGLGYLGFLFGPPTIGFVSQITSLRLALCLVVALSFLGAWLADAMDRLGEPQ